MAYRDRLLEVFRRGSMKDGTASLWKGEEGRDRDGCEAVAAKVVSDVLHLAEPVYGDEQGEWMGDYIDVDTLKLWAATMGVDLEVADETDRG